MSKSKFTPQQMATAGIIAAIYAVLTLALPIPQYGGMPVDWIVGTAATLIAAIWTSKLHHRALAPLPPVICNMVLVGAEIAWFFPAEGMGFWSAFGINALTVGIGEAAACFILGSLLLRVLPRVPALKRWMAPSRV